MMRVSKNHGQAQKKAGQASRTIGRVVSMRSIYKRLETIVAARRQDEAELAKSGNTRYIRKKLLESEPQPAAKLLVATTQFSAMAASLERHPEAQQAKDFLLPLVEAIAVAKVSIRRKKGTHVNKNLQSKALHLVLDTAEACERAISMAISTGEKDPAWPTVRIDTTSLKNKISDIANLLESATPRTTADHDNDNNNNNDKSSALSDSTRSISSQSGPPSLSSDSGKSSSVHSTPFSPRVGRQRKHRPRCAPVSPGAAFVRGRRPSVRVDPRASNLSGTGAICR